MNNRCIEQTIELLETSVLSEEASNKELAELIVNHAKIPFFRIDQKERLLTDILGIETRKIWDNIYYVEKVINNQVNYVCEGDYVLVPRKLDDMFTHNAQIVEDYLYVLKIHEGECNLRKEIIHMNLRGKKKPVFDDNTWKYLKIENFSHYQENEDLTAENIIIDLRCNSGGIIADMKSVFERIYGSPIKQYYKPETDEMDFRTEINKKRENVYIIVDRSTCSSAEIFTGLSKFYHNAILIGTKMYGKNILCKRRLIGQNIVHIPDKKYTVKGKNILDLVPDCYVDNICEFNEEEILNFCRNLKSKEIDESEEF